MKWTRMMVAGLVLGMMAALTPARAADPVRTTFFGNLALEGYDTVAYFTDGKPVKGEKDITLEYKGATWRFASREHLEAFRQDPDAYAPRYGGYCAWAVAQNKEAPGDPRYWKIVDGKLYLNYNRDVQETWEKNIPGFIEDADRNWPGLVKDE